jgi:hypothetical protein
MLKITVEKVLPDTWLILEGSLSGPWVTELNKAFIDSRCQPDTLKLDYCYPVPRRTRAFVNP